MGSRIVMATLGSYGDVNPYVGLAVGLQARGHRVRLVTSVAYREWVEGHGVEFAPSRPDLDPDDIETAARMVDRFRGTEVILREWLLPALRDSYQDLSAAAEDADLLLTHPITFAGPILAQVRKLPWVSTVLSPMSFFSAYELPVFPPFPWMHGLRHVGLSGPLLKIVRRITHGWSKPVYQFRRELGLPPGADPILDGQHSPDLVLGLFSHVLAQPQPDWPSQVRVTGHIFRDGVLGGDSLSPELAEFLDAGPPPLVFTLGSAAVYKAGGFYTTSARAARQLGKRALLLVGRPENRPTDDLGPDVLVVESAPHSAVFPRAAAIVHSGGIGTATQALRSGRPTLVVPFANDQPDNAYRISRLGVGVTLYPRQYRDQRVVRCLGKLLQDPRYRQRAAAVGQAVRDENGVTEACDALEAVLRSSRPTSAVPGRSAPE